MGEEHLNFPPDLNRTPTYGCSRFSGPDSPGVLVQTFLVCRKFPDPPRPKRSVDGTVLSSWSTRPGPPGTQSQGNTPDRGSTDGAPSIGVVRLLLVPRPQSRPSSTSRWRVAGSLGSFNESNSLRVPGTDNLPNHLQSGSSHHSYLHHTSRSKESSLSHLQIG